MRLLKIIATVGPSNYDYNVIRKMIATGTDAFRINMSHGDQKQWEDFINLINKASNELGITVTKIADLEGPRVRLGNFDPIKIQQGQNLVLKYENSKVDGIPIDNRVFFSSIEQGDKVLIDDGKVSVEIETVEKDSAEVRVIEGDVLEPRKGVVIAGKEFDMPPITDKDVNDMKFIASKDFDYVMVSFVRNSKHIDIIRETLKKQGADNIGLLAKIETPSGVKNIDEISESADGIVVARGDLGMHFPLEVLPMIQKRIIESARKKLKPVILATEIFMSMVERPVPSRGEISDVYKALEEGVDGFLVTSETSIGKYPVQVIIWLSRVIQEAQKHIIPNKIDISDISEAKIAKGVVDLANDIGAEILSYATTIDMSRLISGFRPSKPIYTGAPSESIAKKLNIFWGVKPIIVGLSNNEEEGLNLTENYLKKEGIIGTGDTVIEAARSIDQNSFIVKVKQLL
ncbi:MAG: pyruvate kinase [Caldisphaera sp.]|jgi:pyruvate kinase|uniref:pyruvate kinase n=1 Tax=Caldisphaera sp. TaxID=2060322 RepID=UPI000CAF0BD2|nr:MAG: pyruvate kinase [Caldisphaera sp.]